MKKTALQLTAFVLCLLVFTSCSIFNFDFFGGDASNAEPPRERRTIPYADMVYERPDIEAISARFEELTEAVAAAETFEELMEYDIEVGELYEQFDTMHTLLYLKTRQDVTDTFFDEEYRILNEANVDLGLLVTNFNQAIVDGPFADDYRKEVGDHLYESMLNGLIMNSESVLEYKKERTTLEADYDQLFSTLTVTADGTEYTMEEIYDVDSQVLMEQLLNQYYDEHVETYVSIYARMVELDKLIAHTLGFDDAATMYYLGYNRDYTPADAQTLCDNILDIFAPTLPAVFSRSYAVDDAMTLSATMKQLPDLLQQVDPQLKEAWDFMQEYNLYDCDARTTKMVGSQFTTEISGYDAPFIYTYWRDDFSSATTLIHEFGHFYDFWLRYDTPTAQNLDVAEVYSQGLELLMHPFYEEMTPGGEDATLDHLQTMLFSVLFVQSMFEEFQFRVYELDTFDATVIGRLFAELADKYWMSSTTDENGADHSWFTIPHFFSSPFYTISYVTSGLAALQIWAESQNNWEDGVAVYLNLIHADQNQPFAELLKGAGLAPVHDTTVLQEIADLYTTTFR